MRRIRTFFIKSTYFLYDSFQFFFHFTIRDFSSRRTRNDDIVVPGCKKLGTQSCDFFQTATNFVSDNGITYFFRYGKAHSMNRQTRFPPTENEIFCRCGFSPLINSGEISSFFYSVFINQCFLTTDQTVSCFLPLALLRFKTFLPLASAILARKPCTFLC